MARNDIFTTIHAEGAILPNDLLERVATGDRSLEGLKSEDYHLAGFKLTDSISRSWLELSLRWQAFQEQLAKLPQEDLATGVTRERWLLPLFQELGYGRLGRPTEKLVVEGREYPISHLWESVPIHLLGCRIDLDRRQARVAGAARFSPHSMMQEFLNQSDRHTWGFVANGFKLRILRDNKSLTRQAYVEFDLQAMFDGEVYSDFVLFWLLCHQSRLEGAKTEEFWLERWYSDSQKRGVRALESLRNGVQSAVSELGSGFIAERSNSALHDKLRSGELDRQDYYRQLLRLVYRFIFLLVAESRNLLLDPEADDASRQRYNQYYSLSRLRSLSERLRGTRHADLWEAVKLVFKFLGSQEGCPPLALKGLGSFLWSDQAVPDLAGCKLQNRSLLRAVYFLSFTFVEKMRHVVDYKNLGPEELGSVYESLLEMQPELDLNAGLFTLKTAAGNERKTSGSYYTPSELVHCLLDSALEPVLKEAASQTDPEKAILDLKICDPACGSGHFLIAASHRVAKHLARLRTGDDEPSPAAVRHALRDVIGRCIYGVDINPMSVELCKISLWMESLEPGKPLSFLDHHIRCGNSLIGATPELIAKGLPDEAFTAIEGDDKKACTVLRKKNKVEREGLGPLFQKSEDETQQKLIQSAAALNALPDDRPEAIQAKEIAFRRHEHTEEYRQKKLIADAWCAAFVIRKHFTEPDRPQTAFGITQGHLNQLSSGEPLSLGLISEIEKLSRQYQFFHWHLAFPEVFAKGGFDCLLGNPPWERIKLQEKEWFAERSPEIANAPNAAARKRLIDALIRENPDLHRQFLDDSRQAEGESHFIRNSGAYPLNGRGDVNTYAVFAELFYNRRNPRGTSGFIVPSGIATDDTTKYFFQELVNNHSIRSLFDFENRQKIFPGIDSRIKFSLLTLGNSSKPMEFVFFALSTADLQDQEKRFTLTPEDIALLNPNTRTCPIFRSRKDAELTKAIYRRVPVLIREARDGQPEENPWGIKFSTMFHMSNDSHLFRTREQLESDDWTLQGNIFIRGEEKYLPLYEAKMIHHFDHRWATYDGLDTRDLTLSEKQDPNFLVQSRYWVIDKEINASLSSVNWHEQWLFGWRRITNSTNERTFVSAIFPKCGAGDNIFLMLSLKPDCFLELVAIVNSLPFDFVVRQKLGGTNMLFYLTSQLPVLPQSSVLKILGIEKSIFEIIYTSWDLMPLAKCERWENSPFRWDEERRFLIRCELDAAFFHLYLVSTSDGQWKPARTTEGAVHDETPEELAELKRHFPTPRHAVDYIMDTFPIVKRKDEDKYGEYRTKRVILEIYDAMQEAIRTGTPYQTRLDPPPGDSRCCHP